MRKQMVEPQHKNLSIRCQCGLLGINRNRLSPKSRRNEAADLQVMNWLDALHLEDPSSGARRMQDYIRRMYGLRIGRRRVRYLMNRIGIRARCPQPRTSLPGKGHKIYPYLLRDLTVQTANQVWCSDITYIPMARGFCYLCTIMDWRTRAVVGWSLSTSMDTGLCIDALEDAVRRTGCSPGIMNTDQGSQFSSDDWISALKKMNPQIRISMDGKGRWVDNVFIERLWRSVKYEDIYLKAYETLPDLARGLNAWFERYNHRRPHRALDGQTPWECYRPDCEEAA